MTTISIITESNKYSSENLKEGIPIVIVSKSIFGKPREINIKDIDQGIYNTSKDTIKGIGHFIKSVF